MYKVLVVFLLLLAGCATPSQTRILWHDGKEILIAGQDESMVKVKLGDGEVTVDGRKSSILRDLIQFMLIKESQNPIVNK